VFRGAQPPSLRAFPVRAFRAFRGDSPRRLFPNAAATAEPLSKKFDLDFYRDVPSRNLKGLATRSDGRLVAGPVLTELTGPVPADLLWCFTPVSASQWLIGTGPEGRIIEATLGTDLKTYTTRDVVKLGEPHIFALRRLTDGSILAGTSPNGGLVLIRDGKILARVGLPADSIFDLLEVSPTSVLVATGNPARIYQLNPATFATAGIAPGNSPTPRNSPPKASPSSARSWRPATSAASPRFADGRIAAALRRPRATSTSSPPLLRPSTLNPHLSAPRFSCRNNRRSRSRRSSCPSRTAIFYATLLSTPPPWPPDSRISTPRPRQTRRHRLYAPCIARADARLRPTRSRNSPAAAPSSIPRPAGFPDDALVPQRTSPSTNSPAPAKNS